MFYRACQCCMPRTAKSTRSSSLHASAETDSRRWDSAAVFVAFCHELLQSYLPARLGAERCCRRQAQPEAIDALGRKKAQWNAELSDRDACESFLEQMGRGDDRRLKVLEKHNVRQAIAIGVHPPHPSPTSPPPPTHTHTHCHIFTGTGLPPLSACAPPSCTHHAVVQCTHHFGTRSWRPPAGCALLRETGFALHCIALHCSDKWEGKCAEPATGTGQVSCTGVLCVQRWSLQLLDPVKRLSPCCTRDSSWRRSGQRLQAELVLPRWPGGSKRQTAAATE